MKAKFIINVDSDHKLSNEEQMEMLAYLRNAVRSFTHNYPNTKIVVSKEVSMEEIMVAIRNDSQTIDNCVYYDEAQGRHKCLNELVKSSKCRGVCMDYKNKK